MSTAIAVIRLTKPRGARTTKIALVIRETDTFCFMIRTAHRE